MISLIRIDDRLIHGQVMAVWVRLLSIDHIIVADDATFADAFSQQIMQLAMPANMKLTIAGINDAAKMMSMVETDASHTLVLLKSVEAADRLYDLFHFQKLNVGGIGMSLERRMLWRSIAASSAERASLHRLALAGVDVYLQMIPSDEKHRLLDTWPS